MARNLNPPRTAFHRRVQGVILELENGFGKVDAQLGALTAAVRAIPSATGIVPQILQVEVRLVLGDEPWQAIAALPDQSARDGIEVMLSNNVRTLLLINRKNHIVGMITPSRLLTAVLKDDPNAPLSNSMIDRKAFHCVDQSAPVARALELFGEQRIKRLFVTDGKGTVIGILTLGMCLRWLAGRLLEHSSTAG